MQELRLVAVSEDGTYVVLGQPGRATRFTLSNDERLRAVVRGQFSRLAQYEIEVESPLRPKEIQARIRSGETAEQIADVANVPIERVRWFEGPVLAERAYVAQQAQAASVRRPGDSGPGPRLGEIVSERLRDLGADPEEAQWDSRKRGDGSWLVELTSHTGVERVIAAWVFDPRRRHAMPEDDQAARLSLSEDALQAAGLAARPASAARGRGTVTPFVPRSSQAVPRPPAPPSACEPASEPAPAAVSAAAAEELAEPARAANGDIQAEAAAQGRRAARLPEPQPSPSGIPQIQPSVRETRRSQPPGQPPAQVPGRTAPAPERIASDIAPPSPQRPQAPATAAGASAPPRSGPHPPAATTAEPQVVDEAPTTAEAQAPAEAEAGAEKAPPRRARKAAGGRGRRASVPTWDEIMFGSSRRED
ncbi:MAG TPA: septation protein SepH [Streptosporangiaceae bacterium]|nr:septation protein SepH [Streptosporangiaceae bacterium]